MLAIPQKAERRVAAFVGRRAALRRVAELVDGADRRLLLTGDPGAGKSSLLAWLAGAGPDPDDASERATRERIASSVVVLHFCDAEGGRAGPSLDPWQFCQTVARQLAARFPAYGSAYLESLRVNLNVHMQVGQAETVIGPSFGDVHTLPPGSLFNCVIESLARAGVASETRLLVVDALDEALLWRSEPTIVELLASADLEVAGGRVKLLCSSRPRTEIMERFQGESWDLIDDAALDAGDVAAYAAQRLAALGRTDAAALAERIGKSSAGNFLYTKYLIDYVIAHPEDADDPEKLELPSGLDQMYGMFLRREYSSSQDDEAWTDGARPILGILGVAREKLSSAQLRWLLEENPDPRKASVVEASLGRCLQYLDGAPPDGPFGIYHQSFREFLFDRKRAGRFATDELAWHKFVGGRFLEQYQGHWRRCEDDYGLLHTPTHYFEATRLCRDAELGTLTQTLASLVLDPGFQRAHLERVVRPLALKQALEQALEAACRYEGDGALHRILESALGLETFRREQLRPSYVFDAAARGELEAAEARLEAFSLERHWRQAVLLLCAWLAIKSSPAGADALTRRIEADLLPFPPLPLLLGRVRAELTRTPPPLAGLPADVPRLVAETIVRRMRGVDLTLDPSLVGRYAEHLARASHETVDAEYLSDEASLRDDDAAPVFRSEQEAPFLVAHAVADLACGGDLLREYVCLHAANGYEQYRNRSLWGILKYVLRHPDSGFTLEIVKQLASGALAGGQLAFNQALRCSLLARRSAFEGAAGQRSFDAVLQMELQAAQALGEQREARDAWAITKRSLGAFAEALSVALGGDGGAIADVAAGLPYGFAGYQAPACLSLAETFAIVAPNLPKAAERCLDSALEAAHNVQDPVFCARTTSRVNAMRADWWPAAAAGAPRFDPVLAARHLRDHPTAPEFAPVHVVGEKYARRDRAASSVRLRDEFLRADTLRDLAEHVYQQPVTEFLRLNREHGFTEFAPLPPGALVRVPDGNYGPLVAARIACETLRSPGLSATQRQRTLQMLVPIAARDTIALDAVLSRLVLGSPQLTLEEVRALEAVLSEHSMPPI